MNTSLKMQNMDMVFWIFLTISTFGAVYWVSKAIFESSYMAQFIWNVNTFRGLFAHLPETLPKEHILGAYRYTFQDFYAHLPRSVHENAPYYSILMGGLAALGLSLFLLKDLNSNKSCLLQLKRSVGFLVIIALGLWARLFLAYHTTGNQDMVFTYLNEDILKTGVNIYAVSNQFNYSPIWPWITHVLNLLSHFTPIFPFMFVERVFITIMDLVTLSVVIGIAQMMKRSELKAATLFFLNPISIIVSGYHGQIESLAILFLLFSIYLYLRYQRRMLYPSWFILTMGVTIKHIIINQILVFLTHIERSKKKIIALFFLSVVLFLASFAPYWKGGASSIMAHVFSYSGITRPYGIMTLHLYPVQITVYKYLFLALLFLWPFYFRTNHIVRSSIVAILLFLVFTPGISAQQFVLPVALAAMVPTSGFYFFSVTVTLFLLGNIDELKIAFFSPIGWNYVWAASLIWFLIELREHEKSKKEVAVQFP